MVQAELGRYTLTLNKNPELVVAVIAVDDDADSCKPCESRGKVTLNMFLSKR